MLERVRRPRLRGDERGHLLRLLVGEAAGIEYGIVYRMMPARV